MGKGSAIREIGLRAADRRPTSPRPGHGHPSPPAAARAQEARENAADEPGSLHALRGEEVRTDSRHLAGPCASFQGPARLELARVGDDSAAAALAARRGAPAFSGVC
eukprot:scaffold1804_cov263-Pinguiococcus_pyrenoidosus.AAC.15